ncbi:ABC-2 transporter permease [Paenibacillus albiflavus]|uniref:ABC-2 transporter permease n=1 Tax=Paenibacillus albiflavus TaxID=2545760 RepID=A0A4V2WNT1_9BACL|nr:ABC-2 transporter permease [Paenibacillus albiflavus]TCZ76662.1 ABC-2 transporter permease [Paenibacillus albiflavus]
MLNLLRKDFIALKSSLWVLILCMGVFSIAFIPKHDASIFTVAITLACVSLNISTMIDIKNHNHNFLVTLPTSRKRIVLAKYITSIIFTLFGVLVSYGIHSLVKLAVPELNKPDYSIMGLLVPAGMMLIVISIYLPLFYSLSKKGVEIISIAFFIILIVLMSPAAMLMSMMSEEGFISNQALFLTPIGLLLLLIASYYVTVYLFTRKNL